MLLLRKAGETSSMDVARVTVKDLFSEVVGDLEKSTGLSTWQLERQFARHLGIPPKTYARVVRFKAMAAMASNPGAPDFFKTRSPFRATLPTEDRG